MCQSGNFWTSSIIPEIRFTENLSDMKLQKFPHCVRGKGFVQSCHSIRYSDSLITVWKLRKLLSHFRQKFREVLISRNIFFVESKFRSFPHCADGPNSVERKTSRVTSCSLAFWGIVQRKIQPQSKKYLESAHNGPKMAKFLTLRLVHSTSDSKGDSSILGSLTH